MVIVPITPAIFTKPRFVEYRREVRHRLLLNMKMRKKFHCKGADRAKFDHTVSNDTMLVNPATLIGLGIVGEEAEDLE